jgi:hypothetical protein
MQQMLTILIFRVLYTLVNAFIVFITQKYHWSNDNNNNNNNNNFFVIALYFYNHTITYIYTYIRVIV